MQRFGRQHVNRSQTLLRSAWNQFHLTPALRVFSLESGGIIATSSKADIPETENFFLIFYCVSEIYVKFGVF